MDQIKCSFPRSSANFSPKGVGDCWGGNATFQGRHQIPGHTSGMPAPISQHLGPRDAGISKVQPLHCRVGNHPTQGAGCWGPQDEALAAPLFCLRPNSKLQLPPKDSGDLKQTLFHRAQGQIFQNLCLSTLGFGKKSTEEFCAHVSPHLCETFTTASCCTLSAWSHPWLGLVADSDCSPSVPCLFMG